MKKFLNTLSWVLAYVLAGIMYLFMWLITTTV
jgi:hypothetical protein